MTALVEGLLVGVIVNALVFGFAAVFSSRRQLP